MPGNEKTDNGDFEGKLLVRRTALDLVGSGAFVLDCFAGEGHMFREVWSKATGGYLGMDQRFARGSRDPSGECLRGDNMRLIDRAMKRAWWNLVDLDAYANPWPLLRQVLNRAEALELVVTATCGIDRAIRTGVSDFAAAVAGASRLSYTGLITRWYDDVIRWALAWATARSRYRIKRARLTRSVNNEKMRYWLLEFGPKTAGKPR